MIWWWILAIFVVGFIYLLMFSLCGIAGECDPERFEEDGRNDS